MRAVLPEGWGEMERYRAGVMAGPQGMITRGTTNPNRLRRVDRWLAGPQAIRLRRADDPLVVDLGYGATPITAVELHSRLRRQVRADVEVIGVEIDAARVRAALGLQRPGLSFIVGGFELPPAGRRPVVVRAFNVLRQYPEADVGPAWDLIRTRLAPGGLLVDGTCDELGRRAAWIAVTGAEGPISLTLSLRLAGLVRPGEVAERLPKALIHRNVPGERVHGYLAALDAAWARTAVLAPFGVRQRWLAMARAIGGAGWPLLDGPSRWRLGELTVAWSAVRPAEPASRLSS